MNWLEITVIVVAAAFVAGVAVYSLVRRLRGKGGCGCDCAHCAGGSSCKPKTDSETESTEKK